MIRTPLRYIGKKEKEIHLILPHIENADTYVEPFIGSCSVLLSLLQTRPKSSFKRYIASDIDKDLIAFWRYVQIHGSDTIKLFSVFLREYTVDFIPTNEEESMLSHMVFTQCRDFFRLDRTREDYLDRFKISPFNGCDFDAIAKVLEDVEFKCGDYLSILKECMGVGTVSTFCDPPYINVAEGIRTWYNSNLISITELRQLLEKCKSFVLSYSSDDLSVQLLRGINRTKVDINRGLFTRKETYYYNK